MNKIVTVFHFMCKYRDAWESVVWIKEMGDIHTQCPLDFIHVY